MAKEDATGAEDTGLSEVTDTMSEADAEAELLAVDDSEQEAEEITEDTSTEEAATESEEVTEEEAEDSVEDEETHQDEEQEVSIRRQNDENARRRIAEREERDRQKREQQDAYLQDAADETDLAIRQLRVDAYNNKVQGNADRLQIGLDRALADIDLFKTGTPEVKEALVSAVDDFERMYVTKAPNGDPLAIDADIYQFLQAKAESIRKLTNLGARQQVQAKNRQKARTDTVPSRTPVKPKVDPIMAAFDQEAGL